MGSSSSKPSDPDFEPGITFTKAFENQMQGKPRQNKNLSALFGQKASDQVINEVEDASLSSLKNSQIVGNLLLKNEEEELNRVKQFADDLILKEFSAPPPKPACLLERDEVVECYRNNKNDITSCSKYVQGYGECADRSRLAFLMTQAQH